MDEAFASSVPKWAIPVIAVVFVGVVLFFLCLPRISVCLVIPHLARAVVGPNYRVLLSTSLAIGAMYLPVIDDLCRLLFTSEMPIGIMTSIVGIPFFPYIFRSNHKGW